jgi:hypothetical protein
MSELPFGERDRCGLYTLLDNDIVQFIIAKDKRDGMIRATQISLLDQSFLKSKEHREIVDYSFQEKNNFKFYFSKIGRCY